MNRRLVIVLFGSLFGCIAGVLAPSWLAIASTTGDLTVEIDGLSNQNGQVCISVFSSSRGFPGSSDQAIKQKCAAVTTPMTVTFTNVTAGNYAIAVIHDANADSALNRNGFGIPTEGFGFSRNPAIVTGPPAFGDSAVLVAGTNTYINIQLKYLFGY